MLNPFSYHQRIIGANTIVQGALPSILKDTPVTFFHETLETIEANAKLAFERLSNVPGLHPVMPSGAMYMMVGLDHAGFAKSFDNDLEIVEAMVTEQSVFCLPGKCFNIPDFFRIVLTVPQHMLIEACNRIADFCHQHYDVSKHPRALSSVFAMEEGSSTATTTHSNTSASEESDSEDEPLQTNYLSRKMNALPSYVSQATRKTSAVSRLA